MAEEITVVCDGYEEYMRPSPEELVQPVESFVRQYVMLAFPIEGGDKHERMWVKVLALGEGKELKGRLVNTPVYPSRFKFRDEIDFNRSEIAKLLPKTKKKR